MTQRPEFSEGAPCWADLITPDHASAERFYGGLFGWSFDPPDPKMGGYVNCRLGGEAVAGMMKQGPGMPIAWSVWLKTCDADATARKLTEAGGAVIVPRHPVGDLGAMLVAADPTGAVIGFWQPGVHTGAARFDVPGAMCWAELTTRDGLAADRFYRALFDYQQTPLPAAGGMDGALYHRDGRPVCTRMQIPATCTDLAPHWAPYFAVSDIDVALARLPALEGKRLHGPFDIARGRVAVIADPHGAVFVIFQSN